MKAPDQIDAMIERDAREHEEYARQARSVAEFHTRAATYLRLGLGCDHVPKRAGESSLFYRCRKCGYLWKEEKK